jgi:hypothetical protein
MDLLVLIFFSYYPALKTLEQLEHTYLPRVSKYRFAQTMCATIPKMRDSIKNASMSDLKDFLESILKHSARIGEIAMKQVGSLYFFCFKLNTTQQPDCCEYVECTELIYVSHLWFKCSCGVSLCCSTCTSVWQPVLKYEALTLHCSYKSRQLLWTPMCPYIRLFCGRGQGFRRLSPPPLPWGLNVWSAKPEATRNTSY